MLKPNYHISYVRRVHIQNQTPSYAYPTLDMHYQMNHRQKNYNEKITNIYIYIIILLETIVIAMIWVTVNTTLFKTINPYEK